MTKTPFLKPDESEVLLALIVDKSGSMLKRRGEVVEGVNSFVETQKTLPGRATLTLTFFDTYVTTPVVDAPLETFNRLDLTNYVPAGGTALNDAIVNTINMLKSRANGRKVVCVVVTDGEENSSRVFSTNDVKRVIEEQQGAGWDFSFIGAGPNAWQQAQAYGYRQHDFAAYNSEMERGTAAAFSSATLGATQYRSFGAKSADWKAEAEKFVKDVKEANGIKTPDTK